MESTINDLQCKLQNTMTPAELTYKTSPAKQPLSPNCTNKKFKKQGSKIQNIFSISLQVAKNKELQEIKRHKNETIKKTPANKIAKEFGTFRVQNRPPITATQLKGITLEEFLMEHLQEVTRKTIKLPDVAQDKIPDTSASTHFLEDHHMTQKNT
ncbi:hypothetical protein J6590_037397 [Homalodisca vitripennis]|nr:hypothetical protein J6590_037397 [Homalodisca vitripennis]